MNKSVMILMLGAVCAGSALTGGCGQNRPASADNGDSGLYALDQSTILNREILGLNGAVRDVTEVRTRGIGGKPVTISRVTYHFDDHGRLTAREMNMVEDGYEFSDTFAYDKDGRPIYPDSLNAQVTRDGNGRQIRVATTATANLGEEYPDQVAIYEYDPDGRITSWQELDGIAEALGGCYWVNEGYEYSPEGRLVTLTSCSPDFETTEISYGPYGMVSETITDPEDNTTHMRYDYVELDTARGNWLEADYYADDRGSRRNQVRIKRTITYYGPVSQSTEAKE